MAWLQEFNRHVKLDAENVEIQIRSVFLPVMNHHGGMNRASETLGMKGKELTRLVLRSLYQTTSTANSK